jgi:hypothetical protein
MTYLFRLGKLELEFTSPVSNVLKQVFEFANAVIALNALLQFANEHLRLLQLDFQPFYLASVEL